MQETIENKTRAGYVSIIGRPNVGKSTLLNALVGSRLSIVTPKPQTTRKRVLGILSTDTLQIVFVDNPGILKPRYELQRRMLEYVESSLAEADAICVIFEVDDFKRHNYLSADVEKFLLKIKKPVIAVINKIDLLKNVKEVLPMIAMLHESGIYKDIVPISALRQASIDELTGTFERFMPFSPFFYDPEYISSQSERFFVSEIIRERVFLEFEQEVPYSCEVNIREFKERTEGKWYIAADIVVERPTQKAIIIGAEGAKIKFIGERTRKEIEEHLEKEIYLELFVKVRQNWRNDKTQLKNFGY